MPNTISCLVITLIIPIDAPAEREPVSPINTLAGGALNHRKPNPAPTKAVQKINNSPDPEI